VTWSHWYDDAVQDLFTRWFSAVEARHGANLRFQELRRGVQALSSLYVERRSRLSSGVAFDGAGKRAAYALFYAPLHFLLVREIARALHSGSPSSVVDLGCGTLAAGAAWAVEVGSPLVEGVEKNLWAVQEARRTLAAFRLKGRVRQGDLASAVLPQGATILAAFTVNELDPAPREALLERLTASAKMGDRVLVVEPMSRRVSPWWDTWEKRFLEAGGREDSWAFAVEKPEMLVRLAKASGLDYRELKARTLWLEGRGPGSGPS